MKIKDLEFGQVEGKDEFDFSKENIENIIENSFYIDRSIDYNDFINGNKTYIYGHKGTGKTSLLKYIEYQVKYVNNFDSISILFKELKNNVLVYSEFINLLKNVKNKDRATQAFWQWFILSLIITENKIDTNDENLIFNNEDGLLSKLANFLTRVINFKYKFKSTHHELEASINSIDEKQENEELLNAGKKIEILKDVIKSKLNNKFYIFIDELETSKISENFLEDSILIKNLIITVDLLNRMFSKNLYIVLAVRTEILNNIFTSGSEINKLLESKGECIQWEFERYNTNHPLIKMLIKKIRYSMQMYQDKDIQKMSRDYSDEKIFHYWFDRDLIENTNNSAQIILNNTWLKPRDIIRMMSILKREALLGNKFNKTIFKKSIKKYSDASWTEIKEELVSIFNEKEIKLLVKLFSNSEPEFSYQDLKAKLFRIGKYDEFSIVEEIIDKIYYLGIIGNKFMDGKNLQYKYYFRGDKYIDQNKNIELHKGLHEYFSVSKKARSVSTNSYTSAEALNELVRCLSK